MTAQEILLFLSLVELVIIVGSLSLLKIHKDSSNFWHEKYLEEIQRSHKLIMDLVDLTPGGNFDEGSYKCDKVHPPKQKGSGDIL